MTEANHKRSIPIAILALAVACLASAIVVLVQGEFEFRLTSGSEPLFVSPHASPLFFWFSVLFLLAVGMASGWLGIVILRNDLRESKVNGGQLPRHRVNQYQSSQLKDVRANLTYNEKQALNYWYLRA